MNILENLDDKFLVINKKHINRMPTDLQIKLSVILHEMQEYIPENKYIVCNQDEPYAEKIAKIILKEKNNECLY